MTDRASTRRGVFFDLYGTLLRYGDMTRAWDDWKRALHDAVSDLGHDVSPESIGATFDGFLSTPEPPLSTPGRTLLERRVSRGLEILGVQPTVAQLAAMSDHCVGRWQAHVSLHPEAHALLREVRRTHAVALVSNFDHETFVHDVLRETGLAEHFDVIVISAEVGYAKPDPRIFDSALERTGLVPADVVYVGDDDVDRDAARDAGMDFIRISPNGSCDGSERSIRTLSELPRLLTTLHD